jgi:RimJ/RimL family protein N-acetyltransferase
VTKRTTNPAPVLNDIGSTAALRVRQYAGMDSPGDMPQPEIKIDELLVRPWRAEDAEAVFQACQDPEIQRWIPIPKPYEMSHAVGFVTTMTTAGWNDRTSASFGVFDAATGELLGSMALVSVNLVAKVAEIGYWTAPAGRGRGVATRAGRAVGLFAFEILGIERLVWRADVGNHASRLVALRIGVQMEGVQRGGLAAADNSGERVDGWIGAMRPGDVRTATPDSLAPGSAIARQARTFGRPKPTLPMPDGSLRPHVDADIDPATEACQDPEALQWTTIPLGYTREMAADFIHGYTSATWLRGESAMFAIADPAGAFCGGIDLRVSGSDSTIGEIGIQVAPWARGHGLATAATRTLCAWGFEALGLQRIVYRAHVGNVASRRVAERAGFTFEGVQRAGCVQRGERRDAWVLSMLETDTR